MAKNNRYVQQHKANERDAAATKHINFGAIVFMIIFIYIVITLISYAMKESVNYTIAETGNLSHSVQYDGMVIRDEVVINSTATGSIRYFYPEGARVRNNDAVFGVVNDPSMVTLLDEQIFKANQSLSADDPVFDESYDFLKNRLKNYVINQHNKDYAYTYEAKKQIENDIAEIRNTVIIQQSQEDNSSHIDVLEEQYTDAIELIKASRSGLVSYKIDGLESVNIDTFQFGDIDRDPTIQDTSTKTMTENGQAVFKIVDNYLWYIAAEIDDECELKIQGKSYETIHLLEEDLYLDVRIHTLEDVGDKTYLILEVDRMVNRYLTDRHVSFTITFDDYEGIKIPESAVASKTYAIIPSEYMTIINKEYSVRKKVVSEEALGQETIDPTGVKSFKRDGDMVYVPISEQLQVGDTLSYTDEKTLVTTEFVVDATIELEGVYVINKGYAVFKFIETNYQDTDYRIVASNIPYGVRIYDRIASEADSTDEYQIIN